MPKVIPTLKAALPYAANRDIQERIAMVLDAIDEDMNEVGFEPSTNTDAQVKELNGLLDEFDEAAANRRAEMQEAAAEAREAFENEETE